MKRLLSLYPYVAPAILAPLTYWLWLREYSGNHHLVALAWGLPILWAYIVPGIGTNVLKVWEFDTRLRLGRFRPHHGFVFGSATALLAWLVHASPAQGWGDALRLALVLASVLGFWNLLYDLKALEAGLLRVYNQPWADGQSESAVALDYAPWFFAGFGGVYGLAIGAVEMHAASLTTWPATLACLLLALVLACAVPVLGYMDRSRRRYGHFGTRPVARQRIAMKPQPILERINQLASDPGQCADMATPGKVDVSNPFVPEEHTQLYYTSIYATLSDAQRLRYNQLFGLRLNEYIMTLEAELIERLLAPLRRHPSVRSDGAMLLALDTMVAEERRHHAGFAAFNRACRPDLYPVGSDRFFSRLPWWTQAMFSVVGWLAKRYAFALWYMMAMEESAKSLARDMALQPQTPTLGRLDPAFVALHHQHMKDETRHVRIDALLIERCMDDGRAALNARLFTAMLEGVVRPTRGGSGAKVIRQLVRDMPELAPREAELIDAVLSLKDDRRFQESLFNRRIMPRTFELFDATPALADLGKKMVGYDRRAPARAT